MKKVSTKDWRNLPIDKWNTTTVHAFMIEETKRKFNAEYVPGGGGPKSQRWRTEQGMVKRELEKHGPEVVRKFIEICWREYFTPNPKQYPYPTYGFMVGYMDRYWTQAVDEVAKEAERSERSDLTTIDEVDDDWF